MTDAQKPAINPEFIIELLVVTRNVSSAKSAEERGKTLAAILLRKPWVENVIIADVRPSDD